MKFIHVTAALSAAVLLVGCMSTTPTREISEGYAIYDIKTSGDLSGSAVADAVVRGIQKNTSAVQVSRNIPPHPLPEEPGRFQLVNPFSGTRLGALAASAGNSVKMATCEDALVTINAARNGMRRYGESTTFFACILPYQGGYHLDIYTRFSKDSGSFSAATLGATLARTVVGDSSQFIPRTIDSIVSEVQATGATVSLVDAYPKGS